MLAALSPLVFPLSDCSALVCPWSERSSSLKAHIYLPIHSHILWTGQGSRFTSVFVTEDSAWLCASQGSPSHSTFCSRFMKYMEMMACVVCVSLWEANNHILCVTTSASMVRMEVVTLPALLSSFSPSTPLDWEPTTTPYPCA